MVKKIRYLILLLVLSLSFVVLTSTEIKAESVVIPMAELIDLGSLTFEYGTSSSGHVVYLSNLMLVRNARFIFIENNTPFNLSNSISAFSSPRLSFYDSSNEPITNVLIEYTKWFTIPNNANKFRLQIVIPIAPNSNVEETNYYYLPLLNSGSPSERVNAFGLTGGQMLPSELFQQQYQNGYDKGYELGLEKGSYDGKVFWAYYDNDTGDFIDAYTYGELKFDEGFELGSDDDYTLLGMISSVFLGLGSLLSITLFYDITIGAILLIPLVFGIISFIVGGRKKDD